MVGRTAVGRNVYDAELTLCPVVCHPMWAVTCHLLDPLNSLPIQSGSHAPIVSHYNLFRRMLNAVCLMCRLADPASGISHATSFLKTTRLGPVGTCADHNSRPGCASCLHPETSDEEIEGILVETDEGLGPTASPTCECCRCGYLNRFLEKRGFYHDVGSDVYAKQVYNDMVLRGRGNTALLISRLVEFHWFTSLPVYAPVSLPELYEIQRARALLQYTYDKIHNGNWLHPVEEFQSNPRSNYVNGGSAPPPSLISLAAEVYFTVLSNFLPPMIEAVAPLFPLACAKEDGLVQALLRTLRLCVDENNTRGHRFIIFPYGLEELNPSGPTITTLIEVRTCAYCSMIMRTNLTLQILLKATSSVDVSADIRALAASEEEHSKSSCVCPLCLRNYDLTSINERALEGRQYIYKRFKVEPSRKEGNEEEDYSDMPGLMDMI